MSRPGVLFGAVALGVSMLAGSSAAVAAPLTVVRGISPDIGPWGGGGAAVVTGDRLADWSPGVITGPGRTMRVSVAADGSQGDGSSYEPAVSADGRFVVFASGASSLAPGPTVPDVDQVYRKDGTTGSVVLVSAAADGGPGSLSSRTPSVSGDGRYVAFMSDAPDLVPGDTNGARDIFVRDVELGTTSRVTVSASGVQGNGLSDLPAISRDGRFVAFRSMASNLVPGDANGVTSDIFLRDLQAGTTTLVSVAADGGSGNNASGYVAVADGGRFVAFESNASNIVAGDTNGFVGDVFVRDLVAGTTSLVSVATGGGSGDIHSSQPVISSDGRYVAFASFATDLVPGDTNHEFDVFVRDLMAGTTSRVSVATDGTQGDSNSAWPSISADGRYVAFASCASTLVEGDTNSCMDVFVRDLEKATTARVSVATDGTQGEGRADPFGFRNDGSFEPQISADGRHVAFSSSAVTLAPDDTNGWPDVYLRSAQGFWTAKPVRFGETNVDPAHVTATSASSLTVLVPALPGPITKKEKVRVVVGDAAPGVHYTYLPR